jgi:hypothetical protein
MADTQTDTNPSTYRVREAVGVFADPESLEAAVDELEVSGFDRAGISVLGTEAEVKERIGHFYQSITEVEDDGRAPQAAFESRDSRVEGEAAAIAFPLYVGGVVGAVAVVATGGALAATVAAIIAGGAAGAGLGGLLARTVARHHATVVEEQLMAGGLVLWVAVPDADAGKRALAVLNKNGAKHAHIHEVERRWGPEDRPLSQGQPDPFLLERDT